jgi:hypothetical protein
MNKGETTTSVPYTEMPRDEMIRRQMDLAISKPHRRIIDPARDKDDWSLVPWGPMKLVVRAFMSGNNKPGRQRDDWKQLPEWRDRMFMKIMRHLMEWYVGGSTRDSESRIHPLAHLICDALIALWHSMKSEDL